MGKYFIGIDLGGTKILSIITDEKKNLLYKIRIDTEAFKGVDGVIENMFSSFDILRKNSGVDMSEICGIGIGVPGPVNFEKGLVYDCPNLPGWKNIAVRNIFESKYNIQTKIENDARVAGLAETRIGAASGFNHVFYVTISTGIGGAMIQHGKIYRGSEGAAGEFGQMRLIDGTVFENRYSGPAIKKIFGVSTDKIPELIKKNDPGAIAAFNHLTEGIGIYLANITTLLNPEIIVAGGGVSLMGNVLFESLITKIKKYSFSISSKNIRLVPAKLGTESGAIGAVELFFNN